MNFVALDFETANPRLSSTCQIGATLLVVGDQDLERLGDGETKSSKHRKAEVLIRGGQALRILSETDFQSLIALDPDASS